jgi:HNH endonuclease
MPPVESRTDDNPPNGGARSHGHPEWASLDGLYAHFHTPHFTEFFGALGGVIAEPPTGPSPRCHQRKRSTTPLRLPASADNGATRHPLIGADQGLGRRTPPPAQTPRTWEDSEILDALQAWTDKHGRTPKLTGWFFTHADRPTSHTVRRRFGSWRKALKCADLKPAACISQSSTSQVQ